jgi:hypothetical protein
MNVFQSPRQIDMMFIEVSADLTMTMVLTTFYVRRS